MGLHYILNPPRKSNVYLIEVNKFIKSYMLAKMRNSNNDKFCGYYYVHFTFYSW